MTIHEKAERLARSAGIPLSQAYAELSRRGAAVRRQRRAFADYGKTRIEPPKVETRAVAYWWQVD